MGYPRSSLRLRSICESASARAGHHSYVRTYPRGDRIRQARFNDRYRENSQGGFPHKCTIGKRKGRKKEVFVCQPKGIRKEIKLGSGRKV